MARSVARCDAEPNERIDHRAIFAALGDVADDTEQVTSARIVRKRVGVALALEDRDGGQDGVERITAMSRGLLNLVTARMISSWPSLVMQTLVAGS